MPSRRRGGHATRSAARHGSHERSQRIPVPRVRRVGAESAGDGTRAGLAVMNTGMTSSYEYREGTCIHCGQELTWGSRGGHWHLRAGIRRLYCKDSPTTWHEVTEPDGTECARNGVTSDGRRYHYSSAHNGYVFDEPADQQRRQGCPACAGHRQAGPQVLVNARSADQQIQAPRPSQRRGAFAYPDLRSRQQGGAGGPLRAPWTAFCADSASCLRECRG